MLNNFTYSVFRKRLENAFLVRFSQLTTVASCQVCVIPRENKAPSWQRHSNVPDLFSSKY